MSARVEAAIAELCAAIREDERNILLARLSLTSAPVDVPRTHRNGWGFSGQVRRLKVGEQVRIPAHLLATGSHSAIASRIGRKIGAKFSCAGNEFVRRVA